MNTRWIVPVVLAALALSICGCKNKDSQLVGKWKAKIPRAGTSPNAAKEAQMAAQIVLELKGDKAFSLNVLMANMEGKWALDGSTVTLTPDKINGQPAPQGTGSSKPLKLTVSDDQKRLTPVDDKSGGATMVFEKDSS